MKNFLRALENQQKPINLIHNEILDKTVSANREKLVPIVKTILLYGRQNMPLRGTEMTYHIMDLGIVKTSKLFHIFG